MSTINKWVSETETSMLTSKERLLSVIYSLGISTAEQLSIVTGWSLKKVQSLILAARDQSPIPEYHRLQKKLVTQMKKDGASKKEINALAAKIAKDAAKIERGRESWVTIIQPNGPRGGSFYTLGQTGITHIKELRREYVKPNAKHSVKSQYAHYYGINEILCRIRRQGKVETDWLSEAETVQEIHYHWNNQYEKKAFPYRPDAFLQIQDSRYYVEFDTGSESNGRLRRRFHNCLRLYNEMNDPKHIILPDEIIWVCDSPKRKQRIEDIGKKSLADYMEKTGTSIRIPMSYCFVAGEDTQFVLGKTEAEPFWP